MSKDCSLVKKAFQTISWDKQSTIPINVYMVILCQKVIGSTPRIFVLCMSFIWLTFRRRSFDTL